MKTTLNTVLESYQAAKESERAARRVHKQLVKNATAYIGAIIEEDECRFDVPKTAPEATLNDGARSYVGWVNKVYRNVTGKITVGLYSGGCYLLETLSTETIGEICMKVKKHGKLIKEEQI